MEPESRCNQGPSVCLGLGDKAPTPKARPLTLSPVGHTTGHSPNLQSPRFLCRLTEYPGRVKRCIWLETRSCSVSFGLGITHRM